MAERGGKEEQKEGGKGRMTVGRNDGTGNPEDGKKSGVYGTTSWGSHDARTLPVTFAPLQLFGFLAQADAF